MCRVNDCTAPAVSKRHQLCKTHLSRFHRTGSTALRRQPKVLTEPGPLPEYAPSEPHCGFNLQLDQAADWLLEQAGTDYREAGILTRRDVAEINAREVAVTPLMQTSDPPTLRRQLRAKRR